MKFLIIVWDVVTVLSLLLVAYVHAAVPQPVTCDARAEAAVSSGCAAVDDSMPRGHFCQPSVSVGCRFEALVGSTNRHSESGGHRDERETTAIGLHPGFGLRAVSKWAGIHSTTVQYHQERLCGRQYRDLGQ